MMRAWKVENKRQAQVRINMSYDWGQVNEDIFSLNPAALDFKPGDQEVTGSDPALDALFNSANTDDQQDNNNPIQVGNGVPGVGIPHSQELLSDLQSRVERLEAQGFRNTYSSEHVPNNVLKKIKSFADEAAKRLRNSTEEGTLRFLCSAEEATTRVLSSAEEATTRVLSSAEEATKRLRTSAEEASMRVLTSAEEATKRLRCSAEEATTKLSAEVNTDIQKLKHWHGEMKECVDIVVSQHGLSA
jgi:hypothetical protein